MRVHKVRIGFVFRPADPDKHGTGQLGRIPPHDDSCGQFPIEFDISGTGEDYIDFGNTMLYVKAKVTALDGTNLPADAAFGPVNLFLHSLFSQVDISLNGTLITASTNTYPYRAMMETLLSYVRRRRKVFATYVCVVLQGPAGQNGFRGFCGQC